MAPTGANCDRAIFEIAYWEGHLSYREMSDTVYMDVVIARGLTAQEAEQIVIDLTGTNLPYRESCDAAVRTAAGAPDNADVVPHIENGSVRFLCHGQEVDIIFTPRKTFLLA